MTLTSSEMTLKSSFISYSIDSPSCTYIRLMLIDARLFIIARYTQSISVSSVHKLHFHSYCTSTLCLLVAHELVADGALEVHEGIHDTNDIQYDLVQSEPVSTN